MKNFDEWLETMRSSINKYSFYVDFEKVYSNVDSMKVELNILNSLIGSKNIEEEIEKILIKYPEVLKCIPILLAVRYNEIYVQDEQGAYNFNFKERNYTVKEYIMFMKKTGLLDLISNHIVNNLVDYVLGIETGLDSNGRKNRGGHQMEELVESYIKKTGVEYYKEMYITEIESKWNIDLSNISTKETSTKRWDFVVKLDEKIYVIETNFYSTNGSKLNETARSYKMLAEKSENIDNFEFMWITDGAGWKKTRRSLKETYDTMNYLFNITDMENNILETLFK